MFASLNFMINGNFVIDIDDPYLTHTIMDFMLNKYIYTCQIVVLLLLLYYLLLYLLDLFRFVYYLLLMSLYLRLELGY
jgi:hypothetical protein